MGVLGPFGLAAIIDLLDGLKLGSYGIHLVVTDRAEAVQAELVARCPEGWVVGNLFADRRDRLAAAAYRSNDTLRLLVGSLDARQPSDQAAARALNTDREWLLREGVCAVVLVVGSDPQDADASHLELQARAPDFWSVRSRVHRVAGDDTERRATDVLLDLLTPRFDGDRAAAARWLDGRTLHADWTQYRLWRDGAARGAWLSLAERALAGGSLGVEQPDAVWVSDMLGDGEGPKVRFDPIGEAIEAKRWPRPSWPSGMLDPMQRALVSALGVALDLDGVARLYRLPEESTAPALTEALLSLGLRRESQVDLVLHLDAQEGLEAALGRCLRQAGGEAVPAGLIERARRLQGALGPIDALVLISDASEADFELLRAALPGRSLAATLEGSVRATFCVCGRDRHGGFVDWVRNQLSIWGSGAIEQRVETETAPLDLRAALAHAKRVVVLVDSSWEELAPSAWHPLEVAVTRAMALTLEEQPLPTRMPATREHTALGRDEGRAIERLRRVGRELAGEPRVPSPVGAVSWPPSMSDADDVLGRALQLLTMPLPRQAGLAQMLVPMYQVVSFEGRATELSRLQRFSEQPTRDGALVIVGPGGSGKTRVMIEHCQRLRSQGWIAGFLRRPLDDPGPLTQGTTPRLVVLDHAETQPETGARLLRMMARRPSGPRMRVVLLARSDGAWLEALQREIEYVLGEHGILWLPPLYGSRQILHRSYAAALDRFRELAMPNSVPRALERKSNLDDDIGQHVLYVHMQALLEANGDSDAALGLLSAQERLERVLDKERSRWRLALEARKIEVTASLQRGAERAAASLVLCGAATSPSAARDLFEFVTTDLESTQREAIVECFADLYGQEGEYGAIIPLEPNLIGETLVAQVLGDAEVVGNLDDWLALPFTEHAPPGAIDRSLAVLSRLASRSVGERWLIDLLRARGVELVERINRAANRPIHETAGSEGEELGLSALVLADAVRLTDDWALASTIGDSIPRRTVVLREVETAAYGRALECFDLKPGEADEQRARLLLSYGRSLSNLGRREESLQVTQEAAESYRQLAQERPEAFLPGLAMSLNNLGMGLNASGRREEALQVTEEAVESYRQLAQERPEAFLPDLAMSLNNLGAYLNASGRREEALQAAEQAVESYQRLAQERPEAFLPDLASALNNLGTGLTALGRREEALQATEEAVESYRRLAQERPDAFLLDLAMSLNNLGTKLSKVGRREEALQTTQEAVELCRQLTRERPDVFLPNLAMSLNNLGADLNALGRRGEALQVTQEAVESYQQLARERPDVFLPNLAMSLNNLGADLNALGKREEALQVTRGAVESYRQLAQERPEAFLPDLAMSLNNLGASLNALGRREEALQVTRGAVESYRQLAQERPEAFLPDLATSLNNLGNFLSELGKREEALQVTRGAVESCRQLAQERPEAFLPDLAISLNNLGIRLSELGRRQEALQATEEAVGLRRQLAQERPEAFLPGLAMSLTNLGNRLSELGRREEALQVTQEAVESYRWLAQEQPEAFLPDLTNALNNLAVDLNSLGRQQEALQAIQESVELRRQQAQERPEAFLPHLAISLGVRGTVLRSSGMHAEAMESFVDGLRAVLPLFTRLPDAFGGLVASLLRGVTVTSQAANLPIPEDLRPLIDQQTDDP